METVEVINVIKIKQENWSHQIVFKSGIPIKAYCFIMKITVHSSNSIWHEWRNILPSFNIIEADIIIIHI